MEFTNQQHKGTCQDTEPSLELTINRLPDEVLLEIFDFYRQTTDPYDHQWKKKYEWLNLAHVCERWRAVTFTSSSRLDLSITVGPQKPGHIKTVLSSPLPISIEYMSFIEDITGSAIWRMRAALRHRDRVREISFGWLGFPPLATDWTERRRVVSFFEKFITATNFHFPALESLTLYFMYGHEPEFPATFLRGPDQSDLRLRHLKLHNPPFASLSGLLLSATALTNLTLSNITPDAGAFDPSQRSFQILFTCLQGMQCLRNLDISTPYYLQNSQPQLPTPKDIVLLSKLTRFHYSGPTILLNNLMSGLSTPSLQDGHFVLSTRSPSLHLPWVIDDVRGEFRSIKITFNTDYFCFFSSESPHPAKIDCFKPPFELTIQCNCFLGSIQPISSAPSTKLAMVEELALVLITSDRTEWARDFSFREFLRQFRCVKVLRVNSFIPEVECCLHEDGILPLLEEIEVSIRRWAGDSDEEYQRRAAEELAAFGPFVSARERAGSVVKVHHRDSK